MWPSPNPEGSTLYCFFCCNDTTHRGRSQEVYTWVSLSQATARVHISLPKYICVLDVQTAPGWSHQPSLAGAISIQEPPGVILSVTANALVRTLLMRLYIHCTSIVRTVALGPYVQKRSRGPRLSPLVPISIAFFLLHKA